MSSESKINVRTSLLNALNPNEIGYREGMKTDEVALRNYWNTSVELTKAGVSTNAVLTWTEQVLKELAYPTEFYSDIKDRFEDEVVNYQKQLEISEVVREEMEELLLKIYRMYEPESSEDTEQLNQMIFGALEDLGLETNNPDIFIDNVSARED